VPSFPKVTFPLAVKDKDAVLDWGFNWNDPTAVGGPWLEEGETITTSEWIAPDVVDGIVIDSDTNTTTTTTVWISGGTVGVVYLLTNRITTTGGRIDDRSWEIKVVDR
jgi:hypothetical protein